MINVEHFLAHGPTCAVCSNGLGVDGAAIFKGSYCSVDCLNADTLIKDSQRRYQAQEDVAGVVWGWNRFFIFLGDIFWGWVIYHLIFVAIAVIALLVFAIVQIT